MPSSIQSLGRSTVTGASFHSAYISRQHMRPRGAIADRQRLRQVPIVVDGAALRNHRPQRVLRPLLLPVSRRIATSAIRQNSAPPQYVRPHVCVRSSPWSPVARLSFRHVAHHVPPDIPRLQLAGHHPCNRLNVGGLTLLHPMLIVVQRRKRHVHQFMGHHPVVGKIRSGCVLANANARESRESAHVAPCGALQTAVALLRRWNHQDSRPRYGKAAIVRNNRIDRRVDMCPDRVFRQVHRSAREIHLDHGVPGLDLPRVRDLHIVSRLRAHSRASQPIKTRIMTLTEAEKRPDARNLMPIGRMAAFGWPVNWPTSKQELSVFPPAEGGQTAPPLGQKALSQSRRSGARLFLPHL